MTATTSPIPAAQCSAARIVQLMQGSPEWLAYRLTKRNASESAAVLGLSPWTTPHQLWLTKTGRQQTAVTAPMQRGTDLEPSARMAYEALTGMVMQPLVLEAGAYSASLDGMTLDGELLLEIKCPLKSKGSTLWKEVAAGSVPEHYRIQVQHQLMVSGAQKAHLWVFDGEQGLNHTIERDEACMDRIRAGWDAFQGFLDSDTAPPLADTDALEREDEAWQAAAMAFIQIKQQAEEISSQLEAAKEALVSLTQHPREFGAGVSVTRYWKRGTVEYKNIPALQGIDLNPWRSKTRQEVRVTLC